MVVLQRVASLKQYIESGHNVILTYSYSQDSGRVKVKARVGSAADVVPTECRRLLLNAFIPLQHSILPEVVVDRGHQYSNGTAFACFWAKPSPTACAVSVAAAESHDYENNTPCHNSEIPKDSSNHDDAQGFLNSGSTGDGENNISNIKDDCSSSSSLPDLDAFRASEVADASTTADESHFLDVGSKTFTDNFQEHDALGFSFVAMQALNNICECERVVDQMLEASDAEYSSHCGAGCALVAEEILCQEPPTPWIDDPSLEAYGQIALDAKVLVLESLNFATDHILDVMDTLPLSDASEDLWALHEDLISLYPDYETFMQHYGMAAAS